MNDLSNLVPIIAAVIGVAPSTLVLLLVLLSMAAKVTSRLIPNDATGALAVFAKLCAIVGVDVSSRVTSGVTVQDISKATLPIVANQVKP